MPATRSVTPQVLQDRLASLARELSARDDALALLALGSVGAEAERLDAWSDLDFFVLVRDGAKARYIGNLDWLAAAHPVARRPGKLRQQRHPLRLASRAGEARPAAG